MTILSPGRGPALAVDVIGFYSIGKVVLVKRVREPYSGYWALPGGFVEYGERVEDAAVREFYEETGLRVKLLRTVGVYSEPTRDPRGHVVSIAFVGVVIGGTLRTSNETKEVKVFDIRSLPKELAFDHRRILYDGIKVGEVLGLVR
ncbi:MAG: NUDIX hydrolase [Thermoprotei archaeon]|nr:MAG: NUDIX hydrolase [Thermoprotei archaeon]